MRISISISFPFGGVIEGLSAVFRGLPLRPRIARGTPENLDSTTLVAPTGFEPVFTVRHALVAQD